MADTLASVEIGNEWTSANTLTGIAIGTAMVVQNQGSSQMIYASAPAKPANGFMGVIIPARIDRPLMVDAGESEVWLKARFPGTMARANIQEG